MTTTRTAGVGEMETDDDAKAAIDGEGNDRVTLLVRVWLPDRPGALGAVASRIGAVGGDVHEIEVIDRGAGRAVDELVVTVPASCPLELLAREIDEIDGVDIEEVEPVPTVPADPRMQAFAAALDFSAAPDARALARVLAEHARAELRADHVGVIDTAAHEVEAEVGEGPERDWLVAFSAGVGQSAGVGADTSGQAEDVAWAVVPGGRWTVVVTRRAVALRDRERRILQAMADLAGRLERLVGSE